MSARGTRACQACRVRKVRCSGGPPCAQCEHLNLTCDFAPAPARRNPPVRGRLVAQLRNKTAGVHKASKGPSAGPSSLSPSTPEPTSITSVAGLLNHDPLTPSSEPIPAITGCGYSQDFFLGLLPEYKQLVYPVNPVLTVEDMREAIANMYTNYEDAALVHAFGAVTINLTQTSWRTLHGDIAAQMTSLVEYSQWAHHKADTVRPSDTDADTHHLRCEKPITVKRIMVGIWNEISLMAFKRFDRSFASLRESIAMIQMLNIHQYSESNTPCGLTRREISRRQRMYWEAYIHERFLCVMSGFPCTMIPLRTGLPLTDPDVPAHVTVGFNRLISLFRIMDAPLLAHWTAQTMGVAAADDPAVPPITAEWIERKQAQLDADEAETAEAARALTIITTDSTTTAITTNTITTNDGTSTSSPEGGGGLTEEQHVDLFVTRLWLRTLVWQLALAHKLLRSAPPRDGTHEGLSLHFPAQRLSAQLRGLVGRLRRTSSIVTHGSGILQKLFEIVSTVADVLALPLSVAASLPGGGGGGGQVWMQEEEARARMEDFLFVVRFIFCFERTQKHQRDYLREKLELLRGMYTAVDFEELAGSPAAGT